MFVPSPKPRYACFPRYLLLPGTTLIGFIVLFVTYLHVQSWIQENPVGLYLKYNTILIIQNLTQANSYIVAIETSFGTDKPSIGISKSGGMLNFDYHMLKSGGSNLFELSNPIYSGTHLYDKMPKSGIDIKSVWFYIVNLWWIGIIWCYTWY